MHRRGNIPLHILGLPLRKYCVGAMKVLFSKTENMLIVLFLISWCSTGLATYGLSYLWFTLLVLPDMLPN